MLGFAGPSSSTCVQPGGSHSQVCEACSFPGSDRIAASSIICERLAKYTMAKAGTVGYRKFVPTQIRPIPKYHVGLCYRTMHSLHRGLYIFV
jgi:hypothetical protein